jgi:3-hydroxybutyryl-CoA dehydratase
MIITEELINQFAELTGDRNPIHLDEKAAKESRFGRRIAHGFLVGSLISAEVARQHPNAVYAQQSMTFRRPVFIGDDITVDVQEAYDNTDVGDQIVLRTRCLNQKGKEVITGFGVIV